MDVHLFSVMQLSPVDYRIHGLLKDDFPSFKKDIILGRNTGRYFLPLMGKDSLKEKSLFLREEMLLGLFKTYALFVEEQEFDQLYMLCQGYSLGIKDCHVRNRCQGTHALNMVAQATIVQTTIHEVFFMFSDDSFCDTKVEPGVYQDILARCPLSN